MIDWMKVNYKVLEYCEKNGIYELYKVNGYVITYYSYFGSEGFYKIVRNVKTGKTTRTQLRYKKCPKFLIGKYGVNYNYFCG